MAAWRGISVMSLLFVSTSALAERPTVSVGAAGGYDFPSTQPWVGLDIGFHPDQTAGFGFVGRARGGWAFGDGSPFAQVDAGFAGVVPHKEAILRVGAAARTWMYFSPEPVPFQAGTPSGEGFGSPAFHLGAYALMELGWRRPEAERGADAWAIGVRLGGSSATALVDCGSDDAQSLCVTTVGVFEGGFTARVKFHEGVFLELLAGPSAMGTIGYAF